MKGIVSVAQILPVGLLADLEEQKARDAAQAAPAPRQVTVERPPKVIGDPTREPVNRQAAMMTARAGWLYQPLPAEPAPVSELARLRAENSRQADVIRSLKLELEAVKKKLFRLMQRQPAQERPRIVTAVPPPAAAAENPKQKLLERLKNG